MMARNYALALLLLTPAACNKTIGDALRPDDPTAAGATGAGLTCDGTPGRIKPLVVDWTPDERVDLEAAMQGSVVVVKYSCPQVEILPGCSVDGSYSYAGVSRKEQVVQMTNMDDIHANIPLSSGSVGGEIQSGKAIDLATVLIGRRSTTVTSLTTGALAGECEGATHFVRSASLGAFSMGTGSVGKAAVVAEMFGVGGGASSTSERQTLNTDGSLEDCQTSSADADTPPGECQAPIRIELIPISDGAKGEGGKAALGASKKAAADNPCLPGYVFHEGMCTRSSADVATLCEPDDEADCQAQCDKGNAGSCHNYARLLEKDGKGDMAMVPYMKACDADFAPSCSLLGEVVYYDSDDEQPGYQDMLKTAFEKLSQGCDGGDGYGCELKGDVLSDKGYSGYSEGAAFKAYMRACNLGSSFGCHAAAKRQLEGEGIDKDVQGGAETLMRSCQAGSSDECHTLGEVFFEGKYGAPKDQEVGVQLFTVACSLEWAYCETAGNAAAKIGKFELAAELYQRECAEDKEMPACGRLGELYMDGKGVGKDEGKGKQLLGGACDGGDEPACKRLGRSVPD